MNMKVKQIEVTYGIKRPTARFNSEHISVTLTEEIEAADDEELKKVVHLSFLKAREMVETQRWNTDTFGITSPASQREEMPTR